MTVSLAQPIPSPLKGVTPDHAGAALRWFDTMREKDQWGLSTDEQIQLLGGVSKRTYQDWKKKALANQPVELSRDLMERFSLLLGIHKALKIIAPGGRPEVGVQWFNSPNSNALFNGLSPKEFAIQVGTMEALYAIRRYLDAARG